jgi:hypothetical protein
MEYARGVNPCHYNMLGIFAIIVGTSSQGAIMGALVGRGSGLAVGVGVATMLFTRGRDLALSPGTRFGIEPIRPMKFSLNETVFTNPELNNAARDLREVRTPPANTNSGKPLFGQPEFSVSQPSRPTRIKRGVSPRETRSIILLSTINPFPVRES